MTEEELEVYAAAKFVAARQKYFSASDLWAEPGYRQVKTSATLRHLCERGYIRWSSLRQKYHL